MRSWTQTRELADLQGRVFLINWELGSHSSHPAVGYSYVFSLTGHTNAGWPDGRSHRPKFHLGPSQTFVGGENFGFHRPQKLAFSG